MRNGSAATSIACRPTRTPCDAWIAQRIGLPEGKLTRDHLESYQLAKIQDTIQYAIRRSPFYRDQLGCLGNIELSSPADISRIPFTTADQLREHSLRFLCVSQSEINRVVTLDTSGTTGRAKRLYFTAEDQSLTIDSFQRIMATFTESGDTVLNLIPGTRPGSVGDLLATAMRNMGIKLISHGMVGDYASALRTIETERPNAVVGMPVPTLALARYGEATGAQIRFRGVILSTDHLSDSIANDLQRIWKCEVFDHYGMTELGLGVGADCKAHAGYHLREADLYFEIVDPVTGTVLPDGQLGEVVVTTLTRMGMPLIRYRTGDISRFLPGRCPCGTTLRRLERIHARRDELKISTGLPGGEITVAALDEVLFRVPGIVNYEAWVRQEESVLELIIEAESLLPEEPLYRQSVVSALEAMPGVGEAQRRGELIIRLNLRLAGSSFSATRSKRALRERKQKDGKENGIPDPAWPNPNARR